MKSRKSLKEVCIALNKLRMAVVGPIRREVIRETIIDAGYNNNSFISRVTRSPIFKCTKRGWYEFVDPQKSVFVGFLEGLQEETLKETNKYVHKRNQSLKKEKVIKAEAIQAAINLLKENGFKIMKPTVIMKEV